MTALKPPPAAPPPRGVDLPVDARPGFESPSKIGGSAIRPPAGPPPPIPKAAALTPSPAKRTATREGAIAMFPDYKPPGSASSAAAGMSPMSKRDGGAPPPPRDESKLTKPYLHPEGIPASQPPPPSRDDDNDGGDSPVKRAARAPPPRRAPPPGPPPDDVVSAYGVPKGRAPPPADDDGDADKDKIVITGGVRKPSAGPPPATVYSPAKKGGEKEGSGADMGKDGAADIDPATGKPKQSSTSSSSSTTPGDKKKQKPPPPPSQPVPKPSALAGGKDKKGMGGDEVVGDVIDVTGKDGQQSLAAAMDQKPAIASSATSASSGPPATKLQPQQQEPAASPAPAPIPQLVQQQQHQPSLHFNENDLPLHDDMEDDDNGELRQVDLQGEVAAERPPPSEAPLTDLVTLPPAPHEMALDEVTRNKVKRGRFSIRCVSGKGLQRGKEEPKKLNAFVRFKLGTAEKLGSKQTDVVRKCGSDPDLKGMGVSFDMLNPVDYLDSGDIYLTVTVIDQTSWGDEVVAGVTMSVLRFLHSPYNAFEESIPIKPPRTTKPSTMSLRLEFLFEEAKVGMLMSTLYECRNLKLLDSITKQDPFVELALGDKYKKRSTAVKAGGMNPSFNNEQVILWVDRMNWSNDLVAKVADEDVGKVNVVGQVKMSVLPYMALREKDASDEVFQLSTAPRDSRELPSEAGELAMKLAFLPAGSLKVECVAARNLLPSNDRMTRIDPYAVFTVDGQACKIVKKTTVDKDGGSNPQWKYSMYFDIVDQYVVDVEVYNQDIRGRDELIGRTQMSLLPVYKRGIMSTWLTLKLKMEGGGVKEAGDINLSFEFDGPPGVFYPQNRPDVDSFDDTARRNARNPEVEALRAEAVKSVTKGSGAQAQVLKLADDVLRQAPGGEVSQEFDDKDIENAFAFIDLDHNGFVGAAEIRHILVCMGEMITDEEIDMMISMVDTDGDGQVSYGEFKRLVLHPDPSSPEFDSQVAAQKDAAAAEEEAVSALIASGGGGGMDMPVSMQSVDALAFQRQKERAAREKKKRAMTSFITDNDVTFERLQDFYNTYIVLDVSQRAGGLVSFEVFCAACSVDAIGEYLQMFNLFDPEEIHKMDFREFLLGMLNLVELDREERVRFTFFMFDERKSGFIALAELVAILAGNHMVPRHSVAKKAETVLRMSKKQGQPAITLREFEVISKKFPNILYPSVADPVKLSGPVMLD